MKRICVYCGSSPGFDPCYMTMAGSLGRALAEGAYELVYGGADVGLMGAVADTALKAGGVVRGIIPKFFAHRMSQRGLTELHVVGSMHERKQMMFELSDAFIALPGGFGTLEEVAELLTWTQLGLHHKPVGVLDVAGYYQPLLHFLDTATEAGFVRPAHRSLLLADTTPDAILDQLAAWAPEYVPKWTADDQR